MAPTRRVSSRLTTDGCSVIRPMDPGSGVIRHDSRRMRGRDPHETHRTATPLELLFDLTFATSFALAASEVAAVLAEGHFMAGPGRFFFSRFCSSLACVNFSLVSSASQPPHWGFRRLTI